MKKLIVATLALFTCGSAFALPIGNPSEASLYLNGIWCDSSCCDPCDPCFNWCDAWSVRLGFYGDYVFNRHMELENGDESDIDITQINTNAGYVAINICDRLDVFGTFGASKIEVDTEAKSWGLSSGQGYSYLVFQTDFSWSVGARATLWECDCWTLGVEGQYFETNPDMDYILVDELDVAYFDGLDGKYREWQVGVGVSYRVATSCPTLAMVPYMGIKWAGSKLDMDDATALGAGQTFTFFDLEAKKLWGYAVGLTFTMCDMIGVNVEGRFADEKAVSVLGQMRF